MSHVLKGYCLSKSYDPGSMADEGERRIYAVEKHLIWRSGYKVMV